MVCAEGRAVAPLPDPTPDRCRCRTPSGRGPAATTATRGRRRRPLRDVRHVRSEHPPVPRSSTLTPRRGYFRAGPVVGVCRHRSCARTAGPSAAWCVTGSRRAYLCVWIIAQDTVGSPLAGLLIAALAAMLFAVGAVLQHEAAARQHVAERAEPAHGSSAGRGGCLGRAPRCWAPARRWLALALAPVAVVQPMLAVGLVVALGLRAVRLRQVPLRRELLGAALTTAGLAVFLVAARPRPAHHLAQPSTLAVIVAVVALRAARRRGHPVRARRARGARVRHRRRDRGGHRRRPHLGRDPQPAGGRLGARAGRHRDLGGAGGRGRRHHRAASRRTRAAPWPGRCRP